MKSVQNLNYRESQLPTLLCTDPQTVWIKIYTFRSLIDEETLLLASSLFLCKIQIK